MVDFKLLSNAVTRKWVISAPRRAIRPILEGKPQSVCPFCAPHIARESILYEHEGVKVIPNNFPFASVHELVIHSTDHTKGFDSLTADEIAAILRVYKHRYNEHSHKGAVHILHNHGKEAGESVPHAHTQIFVLPDEMTHDTPPLSSIDLVDRGHTEETEYFLVATPLTSQLPDEVWIAPKRRGTSFGEINDAEIKGFAPLFQKLIIMFDHRYNREFAYNFFIYPKEDWYLRLIPRLKVVGGIELTTGIFVNTQLPSETMKFIREHLEEPNLEKILKEHQAEYDKTI